MLTPPASFIEESTSTSTKQQLSPGQIRAKTEAILRKSKSSLKSMEKGSATSDRLPTTARQRQRVLMQEEQDKEASEDASASPTTMRFSESAAKVESTAQSLLAKVAEHSRKGADALALAAKLRRHALDVAQHGKLSVDTGLTGLAEVAERQDLASNPVTATEKSSDTRAAPVGAQKSMFGDLQPIPGDALFENTRKWLQSRGTPSSFDSKKPAANLEEPRFKAIQSSFVHSGEQAGRSAIPSMEVLQRGLKAQTQQPAYSTPQQLMPTIDEMMNAPLPDLFG